ncbi:MFS transporter [Methylobacterium nodulans]|uniref:Major facilitator superfamily MFS_1 n=1 Tax=Methylobacterium nodulans (strain LMG 21967 / CNCM I-2342 / ORS 2060) TaxID=460265 RepID=B8IBX1_METNO|nr:MFS transporter [Methylobacterium nodulans]ACL61153.1 major facilitator superfamily MFS_1 [Methylobacterium nodulans ORS 2060]
MIAPSLPADGPDSAAAWRRLAVAVLLTTIGGVGMWSVVVVLPTVQAEFGIARAAASLPYTLTMVGFALGGVLMGRLADRFGIVAPLVLGSLCLAAGYGASALAGSLWPFTLAHGLLIGVGSSSAFAPLMADTSLWFARRRGIAVSLCAAGNYLAGTIWPPMVQHAVAAFGWRTTQAGLGLLCLATMLPLALLMRRPPPQAGAAAPTAGGTGRRTVGLSPGALQGLLALSGLSCCVAMAMPQVHIVAYCGDLGYGVARGAEMLSLMLGFGIVSRIASGFLADRIGGTATLLLGAVLQGVALVLYLLFDGLISLYVISALFGLFQGGIVPAYAIIVRELFPPREAGARVGIVIMATLFGMALGGWFSGVIFDHTGTYAAAFAHGLLWNLVTVTIALWLMQRQALRGRVAAA